MKKIIILLSLSLSLSAEALYDSSNIENNETKSSVAKWLEGNFGLQPHKVNYILPIGYREYPYESYIPTINYKNHEAELQVSLKLALLKNIFGLHEKYYVSYTQQAFWQLYIDSSPFRESLYNPEVFIDFPISDSHSIFGFRSLVVGYAHESNGQPDTSGIEFSTSQTLANFSRSINYLYVKLRMQHKALITDLTFMEPIADLSDNPDIMDYRGHVGVKFTYFHNKNMFTLMARGNVNTLNGAVEGTYSYPLIKDINLYVKIFSGYGESLIDYNHQFTKYAIGFSFSR